VIVAQELHLDRQLGVEIAHALLRRGLEQLELQTAAEARLVDVDEQRVHLRLVRQLAQQGAELGVDLAQLLAVEIQVDRLPLLGEVVLLELLLLDAPGFELGDLVLRIGEEPRHGDADEDGEQHQDLGRPVPSAGVLPVGALELVDDRVQVERHG
jgi:hypothetical protein